MNAITKVESTIVRASSLSSYSDCARRAATRLVWREIKAAGYDLRETERGIGAAVGTAVHKGASVMLEEKAKSGEMPPPDVATDAAMDTLRAETADGIRFDTKTTINMDEAETQVVRMTAVYRRDVAPDIQPLIVEERLEATIPWSTQGLVLSGQSDVIAREPSRVRDLKTGAKPGNHNPQVGAYSLLARSTGIDVREAGVDFIQRVHITNRTKTQAQPPAIIQKDDIAKVETAAINVLRHIDGDIRTFREGDPERGLLPGDPWAFVANPSSMLCSPKYCPAHGTPWCHEHAIVDEEE
jgi:hypothetical protein